MALIKKFCCGCNVRSGSIFSGFYCLVSSGVFVGLLCVRYVGYRLVDDSQTYAIAAYATVALFMLLLATSVTLVIGVYMDIQMLFVPWLVTVVLCILEASGALVWYIITRLRNDEEIPIWEIAITAYHLVNSIILIYCMVCVISQLQDLIAGKGTSRYYRRRRHLRRQRLPPHITPIPIELMGNPGPDRHLPPPGSGPGMSPPPYSDNPPPYRHESTDDNQRGINEDIGANQPTESRIGGTGDEGAVRNNNERPKESADSTATVESGSLHGNLNNGYDENEDRPGPSRFQQEPLASFHFGDIDLISPAPAENANDQSRESSPGRRRVDPSPHHRKKKKKKRKHGDRSRSPRQPHGPRPHPMHARRPEVQRHVVPVVISQPASPQPVTPSMRPFPPSPRTSRL